MRDVSSMAFSQLLAADGLLRTRQSFGRMLDDAWFMADHGLKLAIQKPAIYRPIGLIEC